MIDTSKPTVEAKNGSQKPDFKELEPWDIAVMLVAEGVTVEFATDSQFQAYVLFNGIPHDDDGIAEWSFMDRCGVINFACSVGIVLKPVANKNNSDGELFEVAKPAPQTE
jgi:hypothetical protein